jgi:hypothetical protein
MELCGFCEETKNCNYLKKYGNYCNKHKRFHLIDSNNLIINDNFTFQVKDYLLKDLKVYYSRRINEKKGNHKKQFYYDEICKYMNKINNYDEGKIIKIQSLYRKKRVMDRLRKNCNNNEDFYTYDLLNEIEDKYFYSYKDPKGFKWGFDVRSILKLIQMNYPNPYTTEKFPDIVLKQVKKKIKLLKDNKLLVDIEEIVLRDRKASIKQKLVDLFSDIELNGYSCQISWFFNMSRRGLKELYKQLEDLWNYRAQLSTESKINICPPDGRIFTTPVSDVMNYSCKEDLQELIIHDVSKFKNAINLSDRKLGYMYFIIALSIVSPPCFLTHQDWVSFI